LPLIIIHSSEHTKTYKSYLKQEIQGIYCPKHPRAGAAPTTPFQDCVSSISVPSCLVLTFDRSWTLKLPDCIVTGDSAPDYPDSRARMRAGKFSVAHQFAYSAHFFRASVVVADLGGGARSTKLRIFVMSRNENDATCNTVFCFTCRGKMILKNK
jgi:hypothetical protein